MRDGGLGWVAAALLAACSAGCTRVPETPSVVLVTLDTTRADRVGAYGDPRARTPALDRLAAEGVLFESAWSVTPLTTPAHASVMTGVYPPAHGVRNNGRFRLPEDAWTVAESFRDAGWRTAAFVGAFPVGRQFGLAQGFETFDDDFGTTSRGAPRGERLAGEVNARALPWISERLADGSPFFVWIHYYDPHEPYAPPEPYASAFRGREYDGEIAYVDGRLGEIVDLLRREGTIDRTVVAVAADHGEGLGEHGEPTHGLLVYEPMIRVPMVLRAPWALGAGERRRELASLVDLAPTLLSLAGLPSPPGIQGVDLSGPPSTSPPDDSDPASRGPSRALYAESLYGHEEFGWAPLAAVRRGSLKWIAAPRPERYDLERDPGETTNLVGRDPGRDAAARGLLEAVALRLSDDATARGADLEAGEDLLERLRSLGYVGGGAGAAPEAAGRAGRDPKDAIGDYNDYLRGTDLLRVPGAPGAVALFDRLVTSDPENAEFRMRLAMALSVSGDLHGAERTYRDLIRRFPDFYLAYRRFAGLLEAQGRWAESRDLWLALRARGGRYVGLGARLAAAYLGTREHGDALRAAEQAMRDDGESAELQILAGRALEGLGRAGEAAARYARASDLAPSDPRPRERAARLLGAAGGGDASGVRPRDPGAVDSPGGRP